MEELERNESYEIIVSQKVEFEDEEVKLTKITPGLTNLDMKETKESSAGGFTATLELIVTGKYVIERFTSDETIYAS